MRSTTTLKLPSELKKRIEPLARRSGKTPHAWMVEALEREVTLAEVREGFIQEALDAAADIDAGGPLFAAEDVHAWLKGKASGETPPRPPPMSRRKR